MRDLSSNLEFGLHIHPEKLHKTLREAIDAVNGKYETILLGYGLCSQAAIGLHATGCTLVIPRVDDCISIFLGFHSAYSCQVKNEPGTNYLTKGWIEVGDTPFSEYERSVERYGKERAERIFQLSLANYKRLALINTGQYELDHYRIVANQLAEHAHLRYEEVPGSDALLKKMFSGKWDDEFVIVPPEGSIVFKDFFR